jgi:hypothetical protein
MVPPAILSEGISFKMGPTAAGQKNALSCQGQKLALPAGPYNRLYLLAAASHGDTKGTFYLDQHPLTLSIQQGSGFIGQWDNRQWQNGQMVGIRPGYIKPDTVAWFASHRHARHGGNLPYEFSYLYKYALALPRGAQVLTLPQNSAIKIFAISAATNARDAILPAQPLFDSLVELGPVSTPYLAVQDGAFGSGHFIDRVVVELASMTEGAEIYYTLDGSEPTPGSTRYRGSLIIDTPLTLKARAFKAERRPSALMVESFEKAVPSPSSQVENLQRGLRFDYYEKASITSLPSFSQMTPLDSGIVEHIGLGSAHRQDNFCYRFSGYLDIPQTGIYTFRLSSDDGSQLYLDDQLVVDNDGLHGFLEGKGFAALQQGKHRLMVIYFEHEGEESLELTIEGTGMPKQSIAPAMLYYQP